MTLQAVNPTALQDLESVPDATERARKALAAMEDARTLMEDLAQTRARAVLELYQEHGASKAARLLGINRVNLYRIIRELPEVRSKQNGTAIIVTMTVLNAIASNSQHATRGGGE
jgi:hypothetical protein